MVPAASRSPRMLPASVVHRTRRYTVVVRPLSRGSISERSRRHHTTGTSCPRRVGRIVSPTLRGVEIERVRRKRPDSLDVYDLFLRALPLAATAMPEDADKALSLLDEAIRLETNYAAVHGFMAWCHEQRYLRGGLPPRRGRLRSSTPTQQSRRAVTMPWRWRWEASSSAFWNGITKWRSRPSTVPWRSALPRPSRSASVRSSAPGWARIRRRSACEDRDSPQSLRSAGLSAVRRPCLCPSLCGQLRRSGRRREPSLGGESPVQCAPLPARGGPGASRAARRSTGNGRCPAGTAARLYDQRIDFRQHHDT